jgi:hypothetical protein
MGVFSNAAEGAMSAIDFKHDEEERKLQFVPCTDDPISETTGRAVEEADGSPMEIGGVPPLPVLLQRLQTNDPCESPTNWMMPGGPSELPYAFAEWAKCQKPVPKDATHVEFTVSDKDLRSTRKVLVSRSHAADDGLTWRIILMPCAVHSNKGGSCFRASRGRAEVQLKCEGTPAAGESEMRFRIAVNGVAREQEDHDFSVAAVAALKDSTWDLTNEVQGGLVRIEAHVWKA